ncbi:MAG: HTTM domain-containing protein [Bacteroidota bacterium]
MTETKSTALSSSRWSIKKIYPGDLISIAPLVTFRIFFGLLLFGSILRFWLRGWIDSVYVKPPFHFTYMGFEWVQPMGNTGMHLLFVLLAVSSLFIMLGLFYRASAIFFFLAFTYVELLDVTTYLNHYYFISLVCFIMIWLPANRSYSLDVLMRPHSKRSLVPSWTVNILRFQMGIVYFFAGLAKLNTDWMVNAIPMRIWLPAKTHLPIVGPLMYESWVAYLFSWFGAFYDLFIVFFLLNGKTRPVAYLFVIIFHVATAIFFPAIGVFPYVMIVSSLIFFSPRAHERMLSFLPFYKSQNGSLNSSVFTFAKPKVLGVCIAIFVVIQLLLPIRFLAYPGHLFWHEEGYRFSWRVMLMEKSGNTFFKIKDKATGKVSEINNAEFLTPLQEKMMSTQPDLILKYAHMLAAHYKQHDMEDPGVYAEIYVALNGERSRLFIDSTIDLAAQPLSWGHYNWVLPYKDKR